MDVIFLLARRKKKRFKGEGEREMPILRGLPVDADTTHYEALAFEGEGVWKMLFLRRKTGQTYDRGRPICK